jgi:hypothetical protein
MTGDHDYIVVLAFAIVLCYDYKEEKNYIAPSL